MNQLRRILTVGLLAVAGAAPCRAECGSISWNTLRYVPGQSSDVSVTLSNASRAVSLDLRMRFPSLDGRGDTFLFWVDAAENGAPACSPDPGLDGSAAFAFVPEGCVPGVSCTGVTALIRMVDGVSPIPATPLFSCAFAAPDDVPPGQYSHAPGPDAVSPAGCDVEAYDAAGMPVELACEGFSEHVVPGSGSVVASTVSGVPGESIDVPVGFSPVTPVCVDWDWSWDAECSAWTKAYERWAAGAECGWVAGIDVSVQFPLPVAATEDGQPACRFNPEGKSDGAFGFVPLGCEPGVDCTGVRAIILSFSELGPVPADWLFECPVAIPADMTPGAFPVGCDWSDGAWVLDSPPDFEVYEVELACAEGSIVVEPAAGPAPGEDVVPLGAAINPVQAASEESSADSSLESAGSSRTAGGGCSVEQSASGSSAWVLLFGAGLGGLRWRRGPRQSHASSTRSSR